MKIANINNLSLVSVAMERLVNRQDGLPGLGVLYGPSGCRVYAGGAGRNGWFGRLSA